jgi:methyltransferase
MWPLIGILGVLQIQILYDRQPRRGWTLRIMTCDAAALTVAGPYRFIRRPAYAIVTIELLVLPMALRDRPVALVWSG